MPLPAAALKPHALFQDHVVLQRDREVAVLGRGKPGATVRVTIGDTTGESVIGADGQWTVGLPPHPAGGPHTVHIASAGETVVLADVLFGDVWLASGQSNMGHKVQDGVTGAEPLIAQANLPRIRHFEVPKTPSENLETDLTGGSWVVATPQTVGAFSAVAFFFAREIEAEEGVPVGIINSSWGGSPIEAWTRREVLARLPHKPGPRIDPVKEGHTSLISLSAANEENIKVILQRVDAVQEGLDRGAHRNDFDDTAWATGPIPGWLTLERQVHWLRRTIEWSADAQAPVPVSLGILGGTVNVYLDGIQVYQAGGGPGRFEIPAVALRAGRHLLAIRISNPWWPPYFEGKPEAFFLGGGAGRERLSLADGWKISGAVEPPLPRYHSLQEVSSALFNGMIHPVLRYPLRGFLWYQGEQNSGASAQYGALFTSMITDWRAQAGQGDLPFLFAQLPNFGDPSDIARDEGWQWLREAQAEALGLPRTAMAVTIDAGDQYDIHPKNKLPVARRLALAARGLAYGQTVEARGPSLRSVAFQDGAATVVFDHARGLRVEGGGAPTSFSLAGEDRVFHRADAVLAGETVVLRSPGVPVPVAVRYAWAGNPVVNLTNAAGLPAEPFRTDRWERPAKRVAAAPTTKLETGYPQIVYWKWTDGIFEPGVLERKIDDICARSGFNTICVSFHWMEAGYFDPRLQDTIQRACNLFLARGRRLLLDIDIRTEGDDYAKIHPGDYSGFAAFLEIELDARGQGTGTMARETVHRFGRTREAGADAVIAAWAFTPEGDDNYVPSSLAGITAACRSHVGPDGVATITVDAGPAQAGKRALIFPRYTHIVPDQFSPNFYVYFRTMFEAVRGLPLFGAAIDEWGHSPIFHFDDRGMHFREVAYSRHMDEAYAARHGRPLRDDLLHLRYGPAGDRLRVVNQYIENFRDRMAHNEAWFHHTAKEFFGADAFVGTHPTWLGLPDSFYLEVLQNGLHWWDCKRDFAQTDESVILPIRLAMAHKAGGAVWYNMFYSAGTEKLETYFPETWHNLRFGGRTHQLGYECPNEKGVKFFADEGALEQIWAMEARVAKLNPVQRASADSRLLVVFGMEACTNWEFAEEKSRRFNFDHARLTPMLRFTRQLFESTLCDLVPSSEIVNGSLTWREGRPVYGNQEYDGIVLLEPESLRREAYDWFERVPEGLPFYIFGAAQRFADAGDATARFAALVRCATWHAPQMPPPTVVAARLGRDGVAPNRFEQGCVLQDGMLVFAADGPANLGNPLEVDIVHRGFRIQFSGEDFLALALKPDGTVDRWACGAARRLLVNGVPVG